MVGPIIFSLPVSEERGGGCPIFNWFSILTEFHTAEVFNHPHGGQEGWKENSVAKFWLAFIYTVAVYATFQKIVYFKNLQFYE
jgi:hypothetical protein